MPFLSLSFFFFRLLRRFASLTAASFHFRWLSLLIPHYFLLIAAPRARQKAVAFVTRHAHPSADDGRRFYAAHRACVFFFYAFPPP